MTPQGYNLNSRATTRLSEKEKEVKIEMTPMHIRSNSTAKTRRKGSIDPSKKVKKVYQSIRKN